MGMAALTANHKPFDLIDVRLREEFDRLHISGARSVPLKEMAPVKIVRQHQLKTQSAGMGNPGPASCAGPAIPFPISSFPVSQKESVISSSPSAGSGRLNPRSQDSRSESQELIG
jgi:hypothetical protein